MAIAMLGYGSAPIYIQNTMALEATLLLLRIFQGFGSCSIQTTNFAITSLIFYKHQAKVMALLTMSEALGVILSPIVGSLLFEHGGFSLPFLVFGLAFLICSLVLPTLMPPTFDGGPSEIESSFNSEDTSFSQANDDGFVKNGEVKLSLLKLLTNRFTLFPLLFAFFNYASYSQIEPIIAIHLGKEFGFTQSEIGLFFTLVVVGSFVGSLLI